MKKVFLFLLGTLVSAGLFAQQRVASSATQYDYEVDGLFYRELGNGEVEVTFHDSASCVYYYVSESDNNNPDAKHTYYSGDISVPAVVTTPVGERRVVRVGDWAFAYADGVTSVTLPEGIKTIGTGAFFRTDLSRLTLPTGLESIGARAFTGGIVETV